MGAGEQGSWGAGHEIKCGGWHEEALVKEIRLTRTRSIWIKSLVIGLLMLVGSLFVVSRVATISIGIGVGIAVANFWLLEQLVVKLLSQKKRSLTRLVLIFLAKVLILFGVIGFVVLKVPIEALPFLLGLSCIVIGIVLEGIMGFFRQPDPTEEV